MPDFYHVAIDLQKEKPLIYTAQSCRNFHLKMLICKFVFEQGGVPVNPFNVFAYYLDEMVDRNLVRNGNNVLMKRCDEIWVFGEVSDGVLAEIQIFKNLNRPIRFFNVQDARDICEISPAEVVFEADVQEFRGQFLQDFKI